MVTISQHSDCAYLSVHRHTECANSACLALGLKAPPVNAILLRAEPPPAQAFLLQPGDAGPCPEPHLHKLSSRGGN